MFPLIYSSVPQMQPIFTASYGFSPFSSQPAVVPIIPSVSFRVFCFVLH
jgi:hypothetical protein